MRNGTTERHEIGSPGPSTVVLRQSFFERSVDAEDCVADLLQVPVVHRSAVANLPRQLLQQRHPFEMATLTRHLDAGDRPHWDLDNPFHDLHGGTPTRCRAGLLPRALPARPIVVLPVVKEPVGFGPPLPIRQTGHGSAHEIVCSGDRYLRRSGSRSQERRWGLASLPPGALTRVVTRTRTRVDALVAAEQRTQAAFTRSLGSSSAQIQRCGACAYERSSSDVGDSSS